MLHYEHEAWQRLAEARALAHTDLVNEKLPESLINLFLVAQVNQRAQLALCLQTLNAYLTDYSVKMGSKDLLGDKECGTRRWWQRSGGGL